MCHTHANGPEGVKFGQIGSLTSTEMAALSRARAAFEPGQDVHSPILNKFGNQIIKKLGKKQFLELKSQPRMLAELLGEESDLDKDGISDATEYLQGTHPLTNQHGDPWSLFVYNFKQEFFHILMIALATGCGLYGLNHMLHWFAQMTDRKE